MPAVVDAILGNACPRLVTFTRIEVTPDLSYAKVFFVQREGNTDTTADLLTAHAPAVRHQFVKKMKIKKVPKFSFAADTLTTHPPIGTS